MATPTAASSRVYQALTVILSLIVISVGALFAMGMLHIGKGTTPSSQSKLNNKETESPTSRYQIEKDDQTRNAIQRAGGLGVFGDPVQDAWVFNYRGGFLTAWLELEFPDGNVITDPLPETWDPLLSKDEEFAGNKPDAEKRKGQIMLLAMRPVVDINQALSQYHLHLNMMLAGGTTGPLHVLPALGVEALRIRPFRLFVSTAPNEKDETRRGYNFYRRYDFRLPTPLIYREPKPDETYISSGADLSSGKDVILLERKQGYSRIRLKARFLGDGEVRQKAGK